MGPGSLAVVSVGEVGCRHDFMGGWCHVCRCRWFLANIGQVQVQAVCRISVEEIVDKFFSERVPTFRV